MPSAPTPGSGVGTTGYSIGLSVDTGSYAHLAGDPNAKMPSAPPSPGSRVGIIGMSVDAWSYAYGAPEAEMPSAPTPGSGVGTIAER